MKQYTVLKGDTFDLISRKVYGQEKDASLIAISNPGIVEPLTAGISIIIPTNPNLPAAKVLSVDSTNENETAILIDGKRFRFWETVSFSRQIDTIDTIEFTAPFNVDQIEFRDAFRPFTYKAVDLFIGGIKLFTGTMLSPVPNLTPTSSKITVQCYSRPGVLMDCSSPASAFPLEFNDQKLEEIAAKIVKPFGLSVEFLADSGAIFEQVAAKPEKKPFEFLSGLAQKRNLVISNTSEGKLLFWRSVPAGSPVAKLEQGQSPVISVDPTFKPQEFFSSITGIEPASIGFAGGKYTVKNDNLPDVIRPLTFELADTQNADLKNSVEAKTGRMYGNAANWAANLSTWRNPNKNLWEPNTTIILKAPNAMIYTDFEFLIRSVNFSKDGSSERATLNLVLPGSFEGKIPKVLPWVG